MTTYTSAASNKRFDSFSLTDAFGNSYLFVRNYSNNKKWFNIAKCEVNTDGHIDENDGLIPHAIPVHAEEVAALLAESEARALQLERIESLLEEWIELRRSRSRRAKQRLRLQKQEVVQ